MNTPTAAMLRAFATIMNSTPRVMSAAARLRLDKTEAKLKADCLARGVKFCDLEDFEVVGGRVAHKVW